MHLLAEEDERRMAAYMATTSDREAAELLGIDPSPFYAWRCRRDLPNRGQGREGKSAEHQRRMRAYEDSQSDLEAAEALGMSESGFRRWRSAQRLPPKGSSAPLDITDGEFYAAWKNSTNDQEAAKILECSPMSVTRWRSRNGVPAKYGTQEIRRSLGRSEGHRKRWQAYCPTTSAEDAADLIDITPYAMKRWMRRMQLPPHSHSSAVRKGVLEAQNTETRSRCRRARSVGGGGRGARQVWNSRCPHMLPSSSARRPFWLMMGT